MTTETNCVAGNACRGRNTGSRSLSHRLDHEWAQLCRRPTVVERVRSWHLTEASFGSLHEFLVLTGHHSPASVSADELLARLVTLARDEPLAGRIVLQRILPGLLAIVRVEQQREPGVDAFDQLISEAWISIIKYPTATRPTDVAARLLNDARHRAFTGPRRRRRVDEIPCRDIDVVIEPVVPVFSSPFDELVGVVTEARRHGLADDHLDIVRGLLEHGTATRMAAARNVTSRTVRNRRDVAAEHIRRRIAAA